MATWTYFHSLDPFIIQFTEDFGLRWYSMAYIMGFAMGYFLIKSLIKINRTPLSKNEILDLIIWGAFGVILGGRMGFALFYAPNILIEFDTRFPYWEFLKVYHGGLASHGGIIGLVVAMILFAKKRGFSAYHCLDLVAFGSGVGIIFGRMANFINGELLGRITEGKTLWAVQFPQEMLLWIADKKTEHLKDLSSIVHKVKINLNADMWNNWIYQFESYGSYKAQIYSVVHSLIKACENGNKEVIAALKEIISFRHPSQIYQAFLEGFIPLMVVFILWRKKSFKPGVIAGVWAVCYGFMRILGEQFRMPDAELGFEALGLTRGQWLSIFMLIGLSIYFILVWKTSKKDTV